MAELETAFTDYFQISERIKIGVEPVSSENVPATEEALDDAIPMLFRLANEVHDLDSQALRPLRALGDVADELSQYLRAQAKKIDLLMTYILANEQSNEQCVYSQSFGGGGFVCALADLPEAKLGQNYQLKLYLEHDAAAVFCFGQVTALEGDQAKVAFSCIREQDREVLVRASLHAQTRQLKKRKAQSQKAP